MDLDDIPSSILDQVTMMEGILIASATGGSADNCIYEPASRIHEHYGNP
ncbi:hypothetical protein [Limoniibacter endophyticus]